MNYRNCQPTPWPTIVVLLLAALLAAGCSEPKDTAFQGYVEGEYLYLAAPLGGQLETLNVRRGDTVAAGDLLFSLERQYEAAAVAEAQQGLLQAESRLADLEKGQRPSELAAIAARLTQARAAEQLARDEWERRRQLFADKIISSSELEQTRTTWDRAQAAVAELQATEQTARLGGRHDLLAAAGAEVMAARERLSKARWQLEQKSQFATAAGSVIDTFFGPGEFVPAAAPVLSLLPPGRVLIRFFVAEAQLGSLAIGQPLTVSFDGAQEPFRAKISFISPRAEYTPPLIYSRDTRSKLVFLVEARPESETAKALHPGQPVDVRLTDRHE